MNPEFLFTVEKCENCFVIKMGVIPRILGEKSIWYTEKIDEHIFKSNNKTLLLFHKVFSAKYRPTVCTPEVEETLKEVIFLNRTTRGDSIRRDRA